MSRQQENDINPCSPQQGTLWGSVLSMPRVLGRYVGCHLAPDVLHAKKHLNFTRQWATAPPFGKSCKVY